MVNMAKAQGKSYSGMYDVPANKGFTYAADRSFGHNYVFEKDDLSVYLIKEPLPSSKKNLNSQIYYWMMNFYHIGFYQEKGRASSFRPNFLGTSKGHFTRYGRPKGVNSDEKVYLMLYTINDKLFRVLIFTHSGGNHPPKEVAEFLESVRLRN
jgi:hypothetical protein